MAGRGRRIGGYAERSMPLRRPGVNSGSQSEENTNTTAIIKKINELSTANVQEEKLEEIGNLLQQICVSGKVLCQVLATLHCKALSDGNFAEKLAIVIARNVSFHVENVNLREEVLKLAQSDFHNKESLAAADNARFLNSVTFLGHLFNKVHILDTPIIIFGRALSSNVDLLLSTEEGRLKVLATQVLQNLGNFLEDDVEEIEVTLRKSLISEKFSENQRAWILVVIDLMTSRKKSLSKSLREFYIEQLGDEFLHLESLSKKENKLLTNSPDLTNGTQFIVPQTPDCAHLTTKDVESIGLSSEVLPEIQADVNNVRQKIKAIGLLNENSENAQQNYDSKNRKWQYGEKLSDDEKIWGLNEKSKDFGGHDDRFSKEDDFYGIQLPRDTKGLKPRRDEKKPFKSPTQSSAQTVTEVEESWD